MEKAGLSAVGQHGVWLMINECAIRGAVPIYISRRYNLGGEWGGGGGGGGGYRIL